MGRQVCACFGAGEKIIIETLRTQKLATVADMGARLKAGTNCGYCVPELEAPFQQHDAKIT
jgi:assimilatory nitrate reductase catalytic subunit